MYILFTYPQKFKLFAWLISKYEKVPFSHTALLYYEPRVDRWIVFQASHGRVHCVGFEAFKLEAEIVHMVGVEESVPAIQFIVDNLQKPYSIVQLFKIFFKIGKDKGSKSFICSELVARAIPSIPKELKSDFTTPRMLWEHFKGKEK
jgi:hypothetical protein